MEVIDDCFVAFFRDILPMTHQVSRTVIGGENKKTQVQLKFDEYNTGCHELSSVHSTELNS
jgi:hypothetical protein